MRAFLLLTALFFSACSAIPASLVDRLDMVVKDNGAGTYTMSVEVDKDGKQLGKVTTKMECTANAIQLTGCHPNGVSFEGPK